MKYAQEITVDAPLATVVKAFDDPANEKYWRPEPISVEYLNEKRREPGARSRIRFRTGKREFSLTETITARKLPDEFSGIYEADTMVNTMKHSFVPVDPGKTLYKTEVEYTFKRLIPRIMSLVMPGFFKRQTYKYMEMFKDFVEHGRQP